MTVPIADSLRERMRRLLEWTQRSDNDLPDQVRQKLLALPRKAALLKVVFEIPDAYRTPLSGRPFDELSRPHSLCNAILPRHSGYGKTGVAGNGTAVELPSLLS
jgi:hypothetical protein